MKPIEPGCLAITVPPHVNPGVVVKVIELDRFLAGLHGGRWWFCESMGSAQPTISPITARPRPASMEFFVVEHCLRRLEDDDADQSATTDTREAELQP